MRLKNGKHVLTLASTTILCLCLCSALISIPTVDAALVWSEFFSAGTLPAEWTVIEGSFSCTNNRLETGSGVWHSAYRASTVAEGEWRFDVHYETVAGMWVAFIAQDTTGTGDDKPQNGYFIEVNRFDNFIRLSRRVNGVESRMGFTPMGASENDYSFTVTRDSSGQFNVWVNDVHSMSATSTHVSSSAYFLVVFVDPGNYIDSIAVYDTIETTTTTGTTGGTTPPQPGVPGFPAIAIAVGLVSAVTIGVLYRRRQSPTQPK